MNKEKQIEEMAKDIDKAKYDMWVGKAHQSGDFTNHSKNIAKALYAKGYRKASDVAREIFQMLRDDLRGEVDMEYLERLIAIYEKKCTEGEG